MLLKDLSIAEIESKVILLKIASGIVSGVILFFSKCNLWFIDHLFQILTNGCLGFFNFTGGLDYYMQDIASLYLW